MTSSIPTVQSPGVCVLLVALSLCQPFTSDPWEGEAWGGKQPPGAGPCLVTEGRLVTPRDTQHKQPGTAMDRDSSGDGVPHVPQPSSLDFAHPVPVLSSSSRKVDAPVFARG